VATTQSCMVGMLNKSVPVALSQEQYALTYCACQELIFISPPPSDHDLKVIYVDEIQFDGAAYVDPERVPLALEYIGSCFDRLVAHRPSRAGRPLRILEVGAGLSWMCRVAKQRDGRHVTVAQDVSPEVSAACPWVDHYIVRELYDEAFSEHGAFDIISLTHVIEHLVDPLSIVKRCRELLSPDGTIFLTAPHRPKNWELGKSEIEDWERYSYNHVPAHVQYFSEGSMRRMAGKAGLSLSLWTAHHEEGEAFEAWLDAPGATSDSLQVLDKIMSVLRSYFSMIR
jgi:SAM-dependent methyltransferase